MADVLHEALWALTGSPQGENPRLFRAGKHATDGHCIDTLRALYRACAT